MKNGVFQNSAAMECVMTNDMGEEIFSSIVDGCVEVKSCQGHNRIYETRVCNCQKMTESFPRGGRCSSFLLSNKFCEAWHMIQ